MGVFPREHTFNKIKERAGGHISEYISTWSQIMINQEKTGEEKQDMQEAIIEYKKQYNNFVN